MLMREQRSVVRALLDNHDRNQVQTLGGYAGCGKTTCLAYLAEQLPGWAPCAFTGKAAHVMRSKGRGHARTLHSHIYHPVEQENGQVRFVLRPRHEIGCEGFLVDEARWYPEIFTRIYCPSGCLSSSSATTASCRRSAPTST